MKFNVSWKEFFEPVDQHFHHVLTFEELNVRCSSDETIQIGIFNSKVNINPVNNLSRQLVKYILSHLDENTSIFAKPKIC